MGVSPRWPRWRSTAPIAALASLASLGDDLGDDSLDHRDDTGLDGIGQVRPSVDDGGQAGVGLTGVDGQIMGKVGGQKTQAVNRLAVT
jgi:hypothetical protein